MRSWVWFYSTFVNVQKRADTVTSAVKIVEAYFPQGLTSQNVKLMTYVTSTIEKKISRIIALCTFGSVGKHNARQIDVTLQNASIAFLKN